MVSATPASANTGHSNLVPSCNCKTTGDKAKQGADTKGVAFTIKNTGDKSSWSKLGDKATPTGSRKPAKWCPPKKETTKPPKWCPPKHETKPPVHKVCPPKHHKPSVTPPVVTPTVVTPPVITPTPIVVSPVVATVPVVVPEQIAVLGVTAIAPAAQAPAVAGVAAMTPVGGVNTGDGSTSPTGLNLGYLLGGSALLAGGVRVFVRRRLSA
jgi:hypothetical protein